MSDLTNEQVKAWLIGAYSTKPGKKYVVVLYNNDGVPTPEYFLTVEEGLAAADTFKDSLIFMAVIN